MADDKYYRITKDEALFNAYNAYANTNNPDDRAKIESLYDSFKKGKISTSEFNVAVMQAAKAQGKANVAKQGGTPTTDGAHTEKVAANPGNGIDAQGKSEIPNSSAVSDANVVKTQANTYDPFSRLNNNVQYVINTLKTYGYPQQVIDSFKQDVDNILANTKDGNRIDAVNQYIDQFLGDKYLAIQDLRRLDSAPGKPAPNQQPQKAKADADAKAAGGTQGVQGAQAGVKTGNAVVGGGVQGSNNKPGKKPRMSDAEINAFLNEELGGDTTGNGTYASADVPKGGTKTIGYGYDPNPGNVSLAYAMRNAPEQERRNALIDKWNQEHGRSGSTYATPGMSTGGTYATGEGIKDANGNNAPMGEGFDYTLTYDPMSNSMRPNNSYSYYDPSRNAPSGGDGTDLTLTYDPMTGQMVRR